MAVETATKISDLNKLWPLGTDPRSEGDDHIRLIKSVLQATDGGALTRFSTVMAFSSGTYTKPAGLKFLVVDIMSAGGGGGGAAATAAAQFAVGGGGGGGAWGRKIFAASALGATTAYTVGAGGGGVVGGAGGAGGTTSFSTLSVTGGDGGALGTVATTTASAAGGAGGVVTGGEMPAQGQKGMPSYCIVAPGLLWGGAGGNSAFGGGGMMAIGGPVNGLPGAGYGGGGGGACNPASQAAKNGAGGSPAFIRMTEVY